jgi:hypothetical protein
MVLEAREHLVAIRVEHARAGRQRRQAEAMWQQSPDAARDELRRTRDDLKRPLVQRINAALTEAAAANP